MPDPAIRPATQPTVSHLPPPSVPTAEPSEAPARVDADAVVEDLARTQRRATPRSSQRAPSFAQASHGARQAFEADGSAGLHAHLSRNRRALGALARRSPAALNRAVGAGAGGVVASHLEGQLRSGIIQQAQRAIGREIRQLDALSASLPNRLEELRSAAPGSAAGRMATSLGIRGDQGDLARARASIEASKDGMGDLLEMLHGRTWTPGDFPASAEAVAARRGLGLPTEGTVLGEVVARRSADEAALAHHIATGAEVLHLGVELGHAAHTAHTLQMVGAAGTEITAVGIGAGVAFGVTVAALGAGLYIHHLGEEQHAEMLAAGRRLGL